MLGGGGDGLDGAADAGTEQDALHEGEGGGEWEAGCQQLTAETGVNN